MNEDMRRLCEAANAAIATAHHGVGLTPHDRDIIVRAVLTELKAATEGLKTTGTIGEMRQAEYVGEVVDRILQGD